MAGETVSLGRVFSRTFETIGRNPLAVFGIALLCGALPSLLVRLLLWEVRPTALDTNFTAVIILIGIVGGLLSGILAVIAQGALVGVVLAEDEGRRAGIGESIMAALSMIWPLVAVAFLFTIGLALGIMLLIVPGIILSTMWSVVMPVVVAERAGIGEAFGRSRALTAGARWKIFGLFLVVIVIIFIVVGIGGAITIAAGGLSDFQGSGFHPIALIVNLVVNTSVMAIGAILAASLYIELRNWKDGPQTRALGDIFA